VVFPLQVTAFVQRISGKETKLDELTNKAKQGPESEELMPLSTAAFRMMLCISMNNDVSQYENMTGHTTRA